MKSHRAWHLYSLIASSLAVFATADSSHAATSPVLTIRARGDLAGDIGPIMQVRVNGQVVGSVEVRSTMMQDYAFTAPNLSAGAAVDVVYTNDGGVAGRDRNLFVAFVQDGTSTVFPRDSIVTYDRGTGQAAFDGKDVIGGQGELYWSGALRMAWPSATAAASLATTQKFGASRFLQQATFGPTVAEINKLSTSTYAAWIDQQIALPFSPDYLNYVQSKFDQGPAFLPSNNNLPSGKNYTTVWPVETFWRTAATSPDQLRRRVGYALQQIFVISLNDGNLWRHARPVANYFDQLNKNAFGNFRTLLEDVALSPAMGLYLSHMRNEKEDLTLNRLPDENFAREVMQLFTIGLYELNIDGSPKLDANGKPIETYSIQDVMGMARVFTGWSWGFDASQMTDANFRTGQVDYTTKGDARIDLRPMRNYAGFHSPEEKRLFAGKPQAVTIPAGTSGPDSVRIALDTLFNHPNVGPFIGRQLIQRLVTSNPSPAYVARVAQAFNNNGKGVRGDMVAVIKAILLDTEARSAPTANFGKLREPVLRVTHWMRAFNATSMTGQFTLGNELVKVGERPMFSPSVFNYYRPGYTPPNSATGTSNLVAPELQIASESTVAAWVNQAEAMVTDGIGWNGTSKDVTSSLAQAIPIAAQGAPAFADHVNLMLFGGQMSSALRYNLLEAMTRVSDSLATRDRERARVAIFLSLASPEYLIQK